MLVIPDTKVQKSVTDYMRDFHKLPFIHKVRIAGKLSINWELGSSVIQLFGRAAHKMKHYDAFCADIEAAKKDCGQS
jgi:hypothetical protein